MGKVLIEKLLRSTDVQAIYLLIRHKRGVQTSDRLKELLDGQLFNGLRMDQPEKLRRVMAVQGDINLSRLGLDDQDYGLLVSTVNIIFHSAATVRFDEDLSKAIPMNVIAVESVIKLARDVKNLEALVHVSTAYANCDKPNIEEKIYPDPGNPYGIIQMSQTMNPKELDSQEFTKKLIGARPNAYTFTKALAENLLETEGAGLPIAIVRPSIVSAAWREPIPGWVDNLNGPTGLIAGALKGVIRSILCRRDMVADMVPVDIPINLMCAVAWRTATQKEEKMRIYNCTSGTLNPLRWGDFEDWGRECMNMYPSKEIVWYPGGALTRNVGLHRFYQFTLGTLPAHLCDTVAKITRRKPIMVKIISKMSKAMSALEYFTQNEWRWSVDNVVQLQEQLGEMDRKIFNFDITDVNWKQYVDTYVQGVRKFVFKEDESTIPDSKLYLKKMYYLDITVKALFWFLLCFLVLIFSTRYRPSNNLM